MKELQEHLETKVGSVAINLCRMGSLGSRRQIDLEQLCRLPTTLFAQTSLRGDRVAFLSDRSGRQELYVLDLKTRQARQVSNGEMPRAIRFPFIWGDPAGTRVIYPRDHHGDEQTELFTIDVDSGKVEQITEESNGWQFPTEVSPDGAWISVVSARAGQLNLWKMRTDGSDATQLTRFTSPAFGGAWSPDGNWLAVTSNDNPSELESRAAYVVSADGSDLKRVLSVTEGSRDSVFDWHPDGQRVAVGSDASGTSRVGVLDLGTSTTRWLTPEGGPDEGALGARFSTSGRLLIALQSHESQLRPVIYDVETGEGRLLKVPDGVASGSDFLQGDTQVLISYQTDTTRSNVGIYDLATDSMEVVVAADYGPIDPRVFAASEHVYYPSLDGKQVPALLYSPPGIAAGDRVPALVHVHGGPTGQWYRGFDPFAQFLVDLGLVVIAPNPRGSTGYGVEWRDAAIGDWGGDDLEDVVGAVDYLKSLPHVDPERIAIFGGSYGGFMTFIAATKKPDLWRAAVAWVGITDLREMYGDSNPFFKYFMRAQMGDPDEEAELWADRSAINFADRLKAHLLMVHGANDPRCPVSQSRLFRDRLLELGRTEGEDFEYVEFADEGHGSNDIEQKIRTFKLLGDYLERVL